MVRPALLMKLILATVRADVVVVDAVDDADVADADWIAESLATDSVDPEGIVHVDVCTDGTASASDETDDYH